jgi:hypothetical protein
VRALAKKLRANKKNCVSVCLSVHAESAGS